MNLVWTTRRTIIMQKMLFTYKVMTNASGMASYSIRKGRIMLRRSCPSDSIYSTLKWWRLLQWALTKLPADWRAAFCSAILKSWASVDRTLLVFCSYLSYPSASEAWRKITWTIRAALPWILNQIHSELSSSPMMLNFTPVLPHVLCWGGTGQYFTSPHDRELYL